MRDSEPDASDQSLVSTRTMDIAVAMVLLIGSIVFMFDSWRSGIGWRDDGPSPGFFPFWVGLILAVSSAVNIMRALPDREAAEEAFVRRSAFGRVLAVLVPTVLYVMAIGGLELGPLRIPGLGMYLASALFITGFMWMLLDPRPSFAGARGGAVVMMLASGALTFALLALHKFAGNIPALQIPVALLVALGLAAVPLGRLGPVLTVGPAAAIALFAMFEVWFLVPLVKGPIESLLGLG